MLPRQLTGLPATVRRPQHGPPVLKHRSERAAEPPAGPPVLVVATEWDAAHGGLSTFNRQLCSALAAAGARVWCQVLSRSPAEEADALRHGVRLLSPAAGLDLPEAAALARKPALPAGVEPELVIGRPAR